MGTGKEWGKLTLVAPQAVLQLMGCALLWGSRAALASAQQPQNPRAAMGGGAAGMCVQLGRAICVFAPAAATGQPGAV